MRAILLAGGYGTRLYPLTLRTPKPLLPVAGKPVLQYTIEMLSEAGIDEIVISLKENQRKIQTYFEDGRKFGVKIQYVYEPDVEEDKKLGSVGAINYVLSKLKEFKETLVIGGDNFIVGLDIEQFSMAHKRKGAHASIALFDLKDPLAVKHFGIAQLDKDNRIVKFQEKPHPEKALSTLASTAIYHLEESFVQKHLPEYVKMKHSKNERADKVGDLWEHFVSELHLAGYPFEGIWGDIGNAEGYLQTNKQAFEFLLQNEESGALGASPHAKVSKTARIIPPVIIEENCILQENAQIGPYVHIMHDSIIGQGAKISNSIIFESCSIGNSCKMEDSIIDGGAVLEDDVRVEGGSVLGFKCTIGESSKLSSARIFPFLRIEKDSDVKGELANDYSPSSKELADSCYWL